jgi:hypothetical protein
MRNRHQSIELSQREAENGDLAIGQDSVAYKSWIDVCADVRAGRLEVLLPEQPGEPAPLDMFCPYRKQFFPAIRRLHGVLRERVAALCAAWPG